MFIFNELRKRKHKI